MPKTRQLFFCSECGGESARWSGQCPACKAWNTMVDAPSTARAARVPPAGNGAVTSLIRDIQSDATSRIRAGLGDFDFVLGGGLVPGSLVLLGGEPGVGKSTLLLQVAARLQETGRSVLYASGEESPGQVRLRAERLREKHVADVHFLAETDVDRVIDEAVRGDPAVIIVDSIQTMHSAAIDNSPGSVAQVRECAARLGRLAKDTGPAVVLVGHVTKDGVVAGPRTLEHAVDVVVYFDPAHSGDHRILRATKNRFGAANEVGVFAMAKHGLEPVENPSALLLAGRSAASGCAVAVVLGGSRPLLVEVQALCTRSSFGAPQRVSTGFDRQRLALLLAVLDKRAGVRLGEADVFLNVVGGVRLTEPGADLAVAAALLSAASDRPVPPESVYFGEIGLGGEVREVSAADRRLGEAARLGFSCAFGGGGESRNAGQLTYRRVEDVRALADLLDAAGPPTREAEGTA